VIGGLDVAARQGLPSREEIVTAPGFGRVRRLARAAS